jgi:hypothetical protein
MGGVITLRDAQILSVARAKVSMYGVKLITLRRIKVVEKINTQIGCTCS